MALVDVLIPTCGRKTGLAIVLTSLFAQTFCDFNVIVSDQTAEEDVYLDSGEIRTLVSALRWRGHEVKLHRHLPRQGMAEQRQFLFEQSRAAYVHFIDDDVILDPQIMQRMLTVIRDEQCGFVGCAAPGLQFLDDVRPQQQHIELWEGPVVPELFDATTIPLERHLVNNAANPLHLEQQLVRNGEVVRYKVAWVGGANLLFDREKLQRVGAFSWWKRLPMEHAGEEVVVQFLMLHEYGGCGILPCGTYHLCLPTNVEDRRHNATSLYELLLKEFTHERTYP
ncbi:MAG TPA: glycosyltransferase family A protein [Ktedonobacteraceae bacterium]|jgi:glycosyltransferase involved in cell wall biosynthesis|nr:glycosyltransferase family A protein [Ktedonobacteraceae bacterium]